MLQFCSQFNNAHAIFTVTWLLVKKDSTCGNKHVDTVGTRNIQECQIYCGNSGFRKLAYDYWEFECDCCSESSELRNMNGRNVCMSLLFLSYIICIIEAIDTKNVAIYRIITKA